MSQLILFNKPHLVLSQFAPSGERRTLAHYLDIPAVYPAGRLDYDSEGLLLLTDDGALQHRISHPRHKLPKTYWVQVEGSPAPDAIAQLSRGVLLNDGPTLPAKVRLLPEPALWPRDPPIRLRKNIPTHWLEITISEGRNRQVRRMTAAVGLPTLRLVRVRIGDWRLDDLAPGAWRTLTLHTPATDTSRPKKSGKTARKISGSKTSPSNTERAIAPARRRRV